MTSLAWGVPRYAPFSGEFGDFGGRPMWGIAARLDRSLRRAPGLSVAALFMAAPGAGGERPAPRLIAQTDTALSRAFARYPRLLPKDGSPDACLEWLAKLKPEDADAYELDDLYEMMCELAGRKPTPEAEQPFEIKAEAEIIDVVEAASALPVPAPPPVLVEPSRIVAEPTRKKLKPAEAAARFVEWARLCARCGTYSDPDFRALYLEHCEAEELAPLGDNKLRSALQHLRGDVRKSRTDDYIVVSDGDLARKRHYRWTILPAKPQTSNVFPWADLPANVAKMRRAA